MTTDLDILAALWQRWPDANIGMATGDGIAVLDIDPRNGGDDSLAELVREHGPLPDTPVNLTGGGGHHYVFRVDGPIDSDPKIAPGIELKAAGALVVLPPSVHASGRRYEWEVSAHPLHVPLAPLPEWIVKQAATDRTPRPDMGTGWAAEWFRTPVEPGHRRGPKGLPRIVGYLRGHGIDCETAIAILELWDRQNIAPLGADEVRRHVEAMYQRYGMPPTMTINNRRVTRLDPRTEVRHAR